MSLPHESLASLQKKLRAGEVRSTELVQAIEERIQAVNGTLNAYVRRDLDNALAQAEAADARRAAGEDLPLLGIPVAVKDLLNVKGQPCECSSKLLAGYISPYDATAVRKLREAGAVIFGRLNMDEFAMGSSNESTAHGLARNPWDPTRVPGGSSGGSAAAVAADIAVMALGSDTGGSVRQPAAFCGCVGIKPSYGRVSRYGLTAFASSLDQIGVLSKTVEDAAISLGVIAGHDPMDTTSVDRPVPNYLDQLDGDIQGMKVGIAPEFFGSALDPEVEAAVKAAIEQIKALCAEPVEVCFPHLDIAIATYYVLATAEASANLARFDGVRYGARQDADDPTGMMCATREAGFGDEVKRRILLGTYVLSSGYYDAYYSRAQKVRTLIRKDFEAVFSQCDVLLAPVAPTPAYKIGAKSGDPLQMYLGDICTVSVNLAGCCGISVPCGFSEDALPIGLQIIGPAFGEEKILKVGHAYERATSWSSKKPLLA